MAENNTLWCKTPDGHLRARGLGINFQGTPAQYNSITDIPNLEVGYKTIIEDRDSSKIRTGITAILPRGKKNANKFVTAGFFSLAGNGDMTGTPWIEETGMLNLPILLTNTFSVGRCHHALISWSNKKFPNALSDFGAPVVLETYDGILSDISAQAIEEQDVFSALDSAKGGSILEGSVGGGTGNICFSYKGGTGTSSRIVSHGKDYIVAALVQANFGRKNELTILGKKFEQLPTTDIHPKAGDGSCVVIIATNAPLGPLQCRSMAKRAAVGLSRLGSNGRVTSGEIFLAFSTDGNGQEVSGEKNSFDQIPWVDMTPFYDAAAQVTEEAIINSLVANVDMSGNGDMYVPALPHDRLKEVLCF